MKAPKGMPSISPVLFYRDLAQASSWLCDRFGFVERIEDRITDDDGVVQHAELELGNGLIILSAEYGDFRVPEKTSTHHQLLYIFVDNVDRHVEHAMEGGAQITSAPSNTSYGARVYGARDYEGYHWIFAQQL